MDETDTHNQLHWVMLGDTSRYVFLHWLIPTISLPSNLRERTIEVKYSIRFSVHTNEDEVEIETPYIFPNTYISFPPISDNFDDTDYPWNSGSCIAIFEEFPYGKMDIQTQYQSLSKKFRTVVVVLMALPRHTASTDLDSPEEALEQVRQQYTANGTNHILAQNHKDMVSVLHWHPNSVVHWKAQIKDDVDKFRQYIDWFEDFYKDFLENDLPEDFNIGKIDRLLSYDTVKKCHKSSIWDCFSEATCKMLFPPNYNSGIYKSLEVYQGCFVEVDSLVIWNTEQDLDSLRAVLRQEFGIILQKSERENSFREKTLLPEKFTKKDYESLANRPGVKSDGVIFEFRNIIDTFVNSDVKRILKTALYNKYSKIKEMLS